MREAWDLGAAAVGATIYWGSAESDRQLVEIANAFQHAHELGMATVLWCYVRNPAFKKDGVSYETAADLTGQANHLGVSIQADIIKQKLPDTNRGFEVIGFGKTAPAVYDKLSSDHPIDLCRYRSSTATWDGRDDQLGRRVTRNRRPRGGCAHLRHQQARRRDGVDLGA